MKLAQDKLLKLQALKWFPNAVDLTLTQEEQGSNWEIRMPSIDLAPSKEASAIAQLESKVQQHVKRSAADVPKSRAAILSRNAGKRIEKFASKEAREKIQEYAVAFDAFAGGSGSVVEAVDANQAAQEAIETALARNVENETVRVSDIRTLAKIYRALQSEQEEIDRPSEPPGGPSGSEPMGSATALDSKDSHNKVIALLRDGQIVTPRSSSFEAQAVVLAGAGVTSTAQTFAPLYGTELNAPTPEEEIDIMKSAEAGVAIQTRKQQLKGTGILIGQNLILTCGHVLGGRDAYVKIEDYEVISDRRDEHGALQRYVYPLGRRVAYGTVWPVSGNDLDYALFEVAPDDKGVAISDRIKEPREIALADVKRAAGIYLSGYAEGGRGRTRPTGKVIYPYLDDLGGETYFQLVTEAEREGFDGKLFNRRWDEFKNAYVKSGNRFCLLRSVGSAGLQPVYGVECNAFSGHSGSPVFSMERRQLIGVFVGGKSATANYKQASWANMQFVLPMAPIIGQLDENPKCTGWKEKYGVRVVPDVTAATVPRFRDCLPVAQR